MACRGVAKCASFALVVVMRTHALVLLSSSRSPRQRNPGPAQGGGQGHDLAEAIGNHAHFVFEDVDTDGSGEVSFHEWVVFNMHRPEFHGLDMETQMQASISMASCYDRYACITGGHECGNMWRGAYVPQASKGWELDTPPEFQPNVVLTKEAFTQAASTSFWSCGEEATLFFMQSAFDPDGNGVVSLGDFANVTTAMGPLNFGPFNCGGDLEVPSDFQQMPTVVKFPIENCNAHFACLDLDKDGKVTMDELVAVRSKVANAYEPLTAADAKKGGVRACLAKADRVNHAGKLFNSHDLDKDGALTLEELGSKCHNQCLMAPPDFVEDCRRQCLTTGEAQMRCRDTNKNGKIDFNESLKILTLEDDNCMQGASHFLMDDFNGDGKIDIDELIADGHIATFGYGACGHTTAEVIAGQCKDIVEQQATQYLRCVDADKDNALSEEEFTLLNQAWMSLADPEINATNHQAACVLNVDKLFTRISMWVSANRDADGYFSDQELLDARLFVTKQQIQMAKPCFGVEANNSVPISVVLMMHQKSADTSVDETVSECLQRKLAGEDSTPQDRDFDAMDANKDGMISSQEAFDAADGMSFNMDWNDLRHLFETADTNHDNMISKEEFQAVQ